jgi:hypothetical protein
MQVIPVMSRIVFLWANKEVAIRSAKHILFLGWGTLNISPSGNKRVCHIQGSEAATVLLRHSMRHLAPVSTDNVDLIAVGAFFNRLTPTLKICLREQIVFVRWISRREAIQCFSEYGATPNHVGTGGRIAWINVVIL